MSDVRSQKSKVKSQKSKVKSQKSKVKSQKSKVKNGQMGSNLKTQNDQRHLPLTIDH
jgi:biotin synthase